MFSPVTSMISASRLLAIGNYLELTAGQTVIDCGCGSGEVLCLWAKYFGTAGVGVDVSAPAIANATALAERAGVADRAQFACGNVREYEMREEGYDIAACLSATMCFGGFEGTIRESNLDGAVQLAILLVGNFRHWRLSISIYTPGSYNARSCSKKVALDEEEASSPPLSHQRAPKLAVRFLSSL